MLFLFKQLFLLSCFCILLQVQTKFPFPKQIWLYWDTPIKQAPITIQLCYNHFLNVAKKEGWNLTLLSDQNLPQYIQDYQEKILNVLQNAKVIYKQNKADLIRLTVLEQHGGVYFDISSILVHGLGWLDKLNDQLAYLMTNMVKMQDYSSNSKRHKNNQNFINLYQTPDIIVPYINLYQSTTQWRSSSSQPLINPEPGYEIWFIACRAHSQAIRQWRHWYSYFYQHTLKQNLLLFEQQGIYFRSLETNQYLNANKAFYYFCQKKQRQLDKQINMFKEDREYAYQYYKVWSFHGEYGPMAYFLKLIPDKGRTMFQLTLEQIKQQYFDIKFYVKFTSHQRPFLDQMIEFQLDLIKNGSSFNQIIDNPIGQAYCNRSAFPVQGSVIGLLLKNNQVATQNELIVLSQKQLKKWHKYCQSTDISFQQTQLSFSSLFQKWSPFSLVSYLTNLPELGTLAPYYQNMINQQEYSLTFWQKVILFAKSKQLFLRIFQLNLVITIGQMLVIWLISVKVFEYFFKQNLKIKHQDKLAEQLIKEIKSINDELDIIKTNKPNSLQYQKHLLNIYYFNTKSSFIGIIYLLTVILTQSMFYFFNKTGDIYSDDQFYLLLIWALLLVSYIEKQISLRRSQVQVFGIRIQNITQIYNPFLMYCLGKILLQKCMITRPNHLFKDSVVCFCILPYLVKLLMRIFHHSSKSNSLNQQYLHINNTYKITYSKLKSIIIFLVILLVFLLKFTNLRFIIIRSTQGTYHISKLVVLPYAAMYILYVYILGVKLWCYNKDMIVYSQNFYMNPQTQTFIQSHQPLITRTTAQTINKLISKSNTLELLGIFILYVWIEITCDHFDFYMNDLRRDQLQRYIVNYFMLINLCLFGVKHKRRQNKRSTTNKIITNHLIPFIYPIIRFVFPHSINIYLSPLLNYITIIVFAVTILTYNKYIDYQNVYQSIIIVQKKQNKLITNEDKYIDKYYHNPQHDHQQKQFLLTKIKF